MKGKTQDGIAGRVVLVVDDDSRIREYIKAILESATVRVLEAGDGLEGLEVFQACRSSIGLVITDIRMPRMTGTDLATSLRLDSPEIPLIFVSGEPAPPGSDDAEKGFLFIEKPFTPKALLDAACQLFDQSESVAPKGHFYATNYRRSPIGFVPA